MVPPPPVIIDAQAVSGITGSISIACWIIVFAPQIYENFRRKSSEGLSLSFVILWLAGDVFNVLGSVLQGVLPTMIILAIYYTFADIVLLWQCLVYGHGENNADLIHLSPANPLSEDVLETVLSRDSATRSGTFDGDDESSREGGSKRSTASSMSAVRSACIQFLMVFLVISAGLAGWYISYLNEAKHHKKHPGKGKHQPELVYDSLAQFFGWLCAILYLGSRIPQILLNYKRKSCDGISFMFFLFACLGNLTYVISILAIDMSWYYLWVNSSWLAGSFGTLALDFTIFVQFFLYNENEGNSGYEESETLTGESAQEYGTF
ncbi:probable vacuolar amino acid transporter Ypq1p [[Candida] railenensis]|uniref:Probable vacuolar amino acid transporter Ypq1p n=1 Tax=[Candida] railenensis TaxID=45579 RepID=A0A9P0QWK2_9ASCO|nr:probable vacuolar amino acid transporter Ypq1p [[Candida] railenensis]